MVVLGQRRAAWLVVALLLLTVSRSSTADTSPSPTARDCRTAPVCATHGRCSDDKGVCVAARDDDCTRSHVCTRLGMCDAREGRCIAATVASCRSSEACVADFKCTPRGGQCVRLESNRDAACRDAPACKKEGLCSAEKGQCVALASDCQYAAACVAEGRCTAVAGQCVATNNAECRASRGCLDDKRCYFDSIEKVCATPKPRFNEKMFKGGIAVMSISGAAIAAGAMTYIIAAKEELCPVQDEYYGYTSSCRDRTKSDTGMAVGISMIVNGGLGVLGSIPMIVIGRPRSLRPGVDLTAVPEVAVRPTGGQLKWRF